MIRHIVFFKLHKTHTGDAGAQVLKAVKERLDQLPGLIPGILSMETGINQAGDPAAADLSLISRFENFRELQAYQIHPAHRDFVAWNRDKCPKYAVVDYEY